MPKPATQSASGIKAIASKSAAKAATTKRRGRPAKQPESSARENEPRITIRQQIIGYMRQAGNVSSLDVATHLNIDRPLAGQHLYLMVRDGIAEKVDDNTWRLVA